MHKFKPPLTRGINIRKPATKLPGGRRSLKTHLIRRVYLSDSETLNRLEESLGNIGFKRWKERTEKKLNSDGDLYSGGLAINWDDKNQGWVSIKSETSRRPLPSQWLEEDYTPRERRLKELYSGPKLQDSNGSQKAPYFLCLETFRKESDRDAAKDNGEAEDKVTVPDALNGDEPLGKMRSFVQIISTPTSDTRGTTLLLHFDNRRYLFGNISEGTQRVCIQRRIGLAKISGIFLTGVVDWSTTGGLVGMILTIADIAISQNADVKPKNRRDGGVYSDELRLSISGGKNLTHLLATTRRFVFRKGLPLDVHEIKGEKELDGTKGRSLEPTYTDENMKLWAMKVKSDKPLSTPRKRSHGEISEDSDARSKASASLEGLSEEEAENVNDQIRKGVVTHMFDSDWHLDALKIMKLGEVQMPAAIFIRNSEGKIEKYEGVLPGGDESVPDIDVLVRTPWPGASIESLPPTTPSNEVISYIAKNKPQRGKFNAAEAKRLGVKPGPNFKLLTEGKSVTTKDGNVVTPEMVLDPTKTGGGFAIVELPDKSYIDNLLNREEWSSKEVMEGVGAIIWILGKGVLEDPRLLEFRERHNDLEHIISSAETSPNSLSMDDAAAAAIRLNVVDPERFPVPVFQNDLPLTTTIPEKCVQARPGLVYQLEPKLEILTDKVVPFLDVAEVVKTTDVEVQRLAEIARTTISDPAYQSEIDKKQKDIPSLDAEIIALGTGSALPSKYRNVSATLLRVPGYGNYLFDCGENTLGQMKRVFGKELPQVLADLKLIWISHLHADHHLGTAAVIKEWYDVTEQKQTTRSNRLMIASDKAMFDWLREYSEAEDYGYSRLHLVAMNQSTRSLKKFDDSEQKTYGLAHLTSCPVNHCHGALAVAMSFPNGFKVAYSGDCLPSKEFAHIGKGATLLIHEATFDDELAGDAYAKKHSTTSDALGIGRLMGARRILLTHFSQRYQKIPVMDDNGGKDQVAIVAFDYMRVKLSDFSKVQHFRPALLKLYEEKEEH